MGENRLKPPSLPGHGSRAELAETHTMSLTAAFHPHEAAIAVQFVIVAGHRIPTQNTPESQPVSFRVAGQARGFPLVEACRPMRGMLPAEVAGHGEIRVRARLKPNLREGPGSSTATSREQGRDDRAIV
jgi:hypothetical protein